jgi:glucan phosphoethanolaminetransferase (alkaline phosphatase superfamily)
LLSPIGVSAELIRPIGLTLVAVTMAAFALAALASFGILPTGAWAATVALGAGSSIALLVLFFHPWLVLGLAIDAVLLWAVIGARWVPAW